MLGADDKRKRPRLESTAAAFCLAVVLVSLFAPLLTPPKSFPSVPPFRARPTMRHSTDAAPLHLYGDLVAQARAFGETGQVPYLEIVGERGRNRAATPAFFTHPVFFAVGPLLGSSFPLETAATIFLLVHLLVGAVAVYFLARRLSVDSISATLAGAVFLVSGRLLDSATTPSEVGLVQCAALAPALLLLAVRVFDVPTVLRGIFFGVTVGWMTCSSDIAAVLSTITLVALTIPVFRQRSAAGQGPRDRPVIPAIVLLGGATWGGALGAYRWLPAASGEDFGLAGFGTELLTPWWYGFQSLQLPFHLGAVTLVVFFLGARRAFLGAQSGALWLAVIALVTALLGPLRLLPFIGLPLALVAALGVRLRRDRIERHPMLQRLVSAAVLGVLLLESIPVQHQLLSSSANGEDASVRQPAQQTAPTIIARDSTGDYPVSVRRSIDRWDMTVEAREPTVVVIELEHIDGLTAQARGAPAMFVDVGNRIGVPLLPGRHEITLAFSPPGLENGRVVSAIALLLLPFLVFATFFRLRPSRIEYRRARQRSRSRRPRSTPTRSRSPRAPRARSGVLTPAGSEKVSPLAEIVGDPPGLPI